MTQISAGPSIHLVIAPMKIRICAYILDALLLGVVGVPVLILVGLISQSATYAATTALICLWHVVWLRTRSATPGKLVSGLLVQPAAGPGRLTWSQILARVLVTTVAPPVVVWLVLEASGASSSGPLSLVMAGTQPLWALVDCLSSLGNPMRQTIHDRVAKTVVVKQITQVTPWAGLPAPVPGGAPPNTAPPTPPAAGR